MPSVRLTKKAVKDLPAPSGTGKQVLYWDPEKRGLGVLCSGISKTKSWVVQANLNGQGEADHDSPRPTSSIPSRPGNGRADPG